MFELELANPTLPRHSTVTSLVRTKAGLHGGALVLWGECSCLGRKAELGIYIAGPWAGEDAGREDYRLLASSTLLFETPFFSSFLSDSKEKEYVKTGLRPPSISRRANLRSLISKNSRN